MTLVVCADHDTPVPRSNRLPCDVMAVPGLCRDPATIAGAGVDDPEALILHLGEFDLGFVQGAIRATGVDPLGVPIVTLGDMPSPDQIDVLAAGAMARHAAFPGSRPEHAKMRWPELISRRRLFALNVPQYVGAPSIDPSTCVAEQGCRLCVDTCPASALTWSSGMVAFDVDTCAACGICVTTCPTRATTNPTITEAQIASQIEAMVRASSTPLGIEFRCRDARPRPLADGWFLVEVPCTGMLTIGWILAPLMLGAGAVATPTCGESGCGIGNDEVLAPRRTAARMLLDELGLFTGLVRDGAAHAIPAPIGGDTAHRPNTFRDADVFLALADLANTTDTLFTSDVASIGVVTIDGATCTICEQCTSVCPPGALASRHHDGTVDISFDPFTCVGCAMCINTCPEIDSNAIILDRTFDLAELVLGNRVILSGSTAVCEVCGGPIAPSAMLDRIQSMLGPDHAGTLDLISRRCLKCR